MADEMDEVPESSTNPVKGPSRTRRVPSQHPKFIDMVIEAILAQTDRKGATLQAIKSFIGEKYVNVDPNMMKSNVKKALEKGLASGIVIRPKASEDSKGVTGRFKIDKVKHAALNKPKKPKAVPKTDTEEKPKKKTVVKKKETLASKSPKKLKTPKKTSKSKAIKLDKTSKASEKPKAKPTKTKGKSPSKPVSKVVAAKKVAAKKSPAKKATAKKAPAKPTSKSAAKK